MSALPTEITRPSIGKNQVVIAGRCLEVRRTDSGVFTTIRLPAPDEYTMPQTVEIMSQSLLARPNEDVQVKCVIGGYGKKFTRKDGTPGLQVQNQLRHVEA